MKRVDGKFTKEYQAWKAMRYRCNNPRAKQYRLYGARGISVDPTWDCFYCFLGSVGKAPSIKHSLGRLDNNKGYIPGNVRWETPKQQTRNTRYNDLISFKGETKVLSDWAKDLGMAQSKLWMRLYHYNWSVEKSLTVKGTTWKRKS